MPGVGLVRAAFFFTMKMKSLQGAVAKANEHMAEERSLRRERLSSGTTYLVREPAATAKAVVVLVHGLGSTAMCWQPVLRYAPADVGLVIPDLPGFGCSPANEQIPLDAATAMIVELLEQLGDERPVTVVAHSVGAAVAMRALRQRRYGDVRRLVLVAGTLLSATQVLASPRAMMADPGLTTMVGINVLAGVTPLCPRSARTIARHSALRASLLWPFLAHPRQVPERDLLAVLPHPGGRESFRAIWTSRDINLATLMGGLDVATRVVHGAVDRLIDERDILLARDLLGSDDIVRLEGCAHWPHIERPAQTATAAFAA